MHMFLRTLWAVCLLLSTSSLLLAQKGLSVRVGVVTYEMFQDQNGELQALLDQLSGSQNPPVRFQIAMGSYREVSRWLATGDIDVALLTAGGYVRGVLQSAQSGQYEYLATMDAGVGTGPWGSEQRRQQGFQKFYHSVCLTHSDRGALTAEDIRARAKEDTLEVLFVHPQSASGALVPQLVLKRLGIEVNDDAIRYMHSHSQVLEALAQSQGEVTTIGFVWDDAIIKLPQLQASLAKVAIAELESVRIPHDVLVARRDYDQLESLKKLLQEQVYSGSKPLFLPDPDGDQAYVELQSNLASIADATRDLLVRQNLRGVGQLLAHAQKNAAPEKPFRLAVVLSGGGARCAYQVGVISEVENYLQQLNSQYGAALDIDLVVGTSGGALNAVPVSMEVSTYREGQGVWREVWESLDQREIILPSIVVRVNAGIWFAFLQMTLIYLFGRVVRRQYEGRLRFFYRASLTVGAAEFVLCAIPFEPWVMLGHNHLLHHLWLWCRIGAEFTAMTMLFTGAIYYFVSRLASDPGRQELRIRRGRIHWVLTLGVLGLPLLQLITMLINEKTLSTGDGIRQTLVRGFSSMLEQHATYHEMDYDVSAEQTLEKRLSAMGQWMVESGLIKRDLVLTTTAIDRNRPEIPSELYFYLKSDAESEEPRFGNRGIDLQTAPDQLMNVVLGSSAIYPAFPGQVVEGMPDAGDRLELVDGGFAHNAPVEAAVLWGATHVLLVDVSPIVTRDGVNLADSMIRGFGHLLKQSQLSDERSRSEVVVVNLQPRFERPLCIIDFSSNLIKRGIDFGHQDALGTTRSESHDGILLELPPFAVSYGRPDFIELLAPVRTEGDEQSEMTGESAEPVE